MIPRGALFSILVVVMAVACAGHGCGAADAPDASEPDLRTQVIVVTDLYHPYQDPGDNLDLITAYGIAEINLRAVILDVTEEYLHPVAFPNEPAFTDATGPREPGRIPVEQLNHIFERMVPFASAVQSPMRAPEDKMLDAPAAQQLGVELLLRSLRESPRKVEIVCTGSLRPVAVAYNREPTLLMEKVERVRFVGGAADPSYLEWNVHLDPNAVVDVLRSPLPVAIYPCATDGPFALGPGNTYWSMEDLLWVETLPTPMRAYTYYALTRSARADYVAAVDESPDPSSLATALRRPHHIWETAVWLDVSQRRLVKHPSSNGFEIVKRADVRGDDKVVEESLRPTRVTVHDDGKFELEPDPSGTSNILVYSRVDPALQQAALRIAVPRWYASFGARLRH